MFNLYRYIEMHGGTEKVDYKDYRPLFMERLYPRMEITPFDIHRPQDMIAQMNRSDPYGKTVPKQLCMTTAICCFVLRRYRAC